MDEFAPEHHEYGRRYGGQDEDDVVAGEGVAAHGRTVVESGGVGHAHGHGRPHAVVYAESQSAGDHYYLERREADGPYHSGHDCRHRERS